MLLTVSYSLFTEFVFASPKTLPPLQIQSPSPSPIPSPIPVQGKKNTPPLDTLDPKNQPQTQLQGPKNYYQAGNVELAKWKLWLTNYSKALSAISVTDQAPGKPTLRKALGGYCHSSESTLSCYARFQRSSETFDTQIYESLIQNQHQQQNLEALTKVPVPTDWNALPDKATVTPVSISPQAAKEEARKKGIIVQNTPYATPSPPRPEQYYKTDPKDPSRIYIDPATQQPVVDEKAYKLALKMHKEELSLLKADTELANKVNREHLDREAAITGKNSPKQAKIEVSEPSLTALEDSYKLISGQLDQSKKHSEEKSGNLAQLPELNDLPDNIQDSEINAMNEALTGLVNKGSNIEINRILDQLDFSNQNPDAKSRIKQLNKSLKRDFFKRMRQLERDLGSEKGLSPKDMLELTLFRQIFSDKKLMSKIFKNRPSKKHDKNSLFTVDQQNPSSSFSSSSPNQEAPKAEQKNSVRQKETKAEPPKKSTRSTANAVIDVHVNLPAFEARKTRSIKEAAKNKNEPPEKKP